MTDVVRDITPEDHVCVPTTDIGHSTPRRWLTIGALALMSAVVSGFASGTLAVFLPYFRRDLALTATQTSAIASTYLMSVVLVGPFAGWLVDRFNARYVIGIGAMLAGGGFLSSIWSHSLASLLMAYVAIGVGAGASVTVTVSVVVANWMTTRGGLAMALVKAGATLGGGATPILASIMIAQYGWRHAMGWIASAVILGSIPVVLLLTSAKPRDANPVAAAAHFPRSMDAQTRPRTDGYWLLILSMSLANIGAAGFFFAIVSALLAKGFSSQAAAQIYAASNIIHLLGLMVLGTAADRRGPQTVLSLSLILSAAGMIVFLLAGTSLFGLIAVGVFVLLSSVMGVGMQELMPLVMARRFGSKNLGKLYGGAIGLTGWPVALAPLFTGLLVDLTGNYTVPFLIWSGFVAASAGVLWSVRQPET